MSAPKKTANLKTALAVAAIPAFFFVMVFVKRIWLN
jgi:hypothetical protein